MEISPQEAQQSLDEIQKAMDKTKRLLASGGAPRYMILWGVVWFFGFLASQFIPTRAGEAWAVFDTIGGVISLWLGYRIGRRVRLKTYGNQVGTFWFLLIVFSVVILIVARPTSSNQLSLLITIMAMLGYVTIGLWLQSNLPVWVGISVTALALFGFFMIPEYFNLWMAFLGGGTMIGSGMMMIKVWR